MSSFAFLLDVAFAPWRFAIRPLAAANAFAYKPLPGRPAGIPVVVGGHSRAYGAVIPKQPAPPPPPIP